MVLKSTHNRWRQGGLVCLLELLLHSVSGAGDYRCFFEKASTDKRQVRQVGTIQRPSIKLPKEEKKGGVFVTPKALMAMPFQMKRVLKVIELIKKIFGEIDMVVYSLASPVRKNCQNR